MREKDTTANFQIWQVDVEMIVCTYLFIYVFIYQAERPPIFWVMSTSEEFSELEGSKPVIFNHYLTLEPPPLFLNIKASFHRYRSPGSIASEACLVPVAFSISCKIEQATVGKMLMFGSRNSAETKKLPETKKHPETTPPPASGGGRKSCLLPYHYRKALEPFLESS